MDQIERAQGDFQSPLRSLPWEMMMNLLYLHVTWTPQGQGFRWEEGGGGGGTGGIAFRSEAVIPIDTE